MGHFARLFEGHTAEVDYGMDPEQALAILPIPLASDDLETTVRKMEALAEVVEQGESLAVRTGHKLSKHQASDPEMRAMEAMTTSQRDQYIIWKEGIIMPTFDWATQRKPGPTEDGEYRRYLERATAMDTIWKHEGATVENVAWLMDNMTYAVPLLTAVVKVAKARKDRADGASSLNDMELAEIKTIRRIVAIGIDNMNRVFRQMRVLSRRLHDSKVVMEAREHALNSKLKKDEPRQGPVNQHGSVKRTATDANLDANAVANGNRRPLTARSGLEEPGFVFETYDGFPQYDESDEDM